MPGDNDNDTDNVIPIERARAMRAQERLEANKARLRRKLDEHKGGVVTGLPALGLMIGMMFAVAMSEPVNDGKSRRKGKKKKKRRRRNGGKSSD